MAVHGVLGTIFLVGLLLGIGVANRTIIVLKTQGDMVMEEFVCENEIGEMEEIIIKPSCIGRRIEKFKNDFFIDYFTKMVTEAIVFLAKDICNTAILRSDEKTCTSLVEGVVMSKVNRTVTAKHSKFNMRYYCEQFCEMSQIRLLQNSTNRPPKYVMKPTGNQKIDRKILSNLVAKIMTAQVLKLDEVETPDISFVDDDEVVDVSDIARFDNPCSKYMAQNGLEFRQWSPHKSPITDLYIDLTGTRGCKPALDVYRNYIYGTNQQADSN